MSSTVAKGLNVGNKSCRAGSDHLNICFTPDDFHINKYSLDSMLKHKMAAYTTLSTTLKAVEKCILQGLLAHL